jgi:Mg-chelatase subunit ChlD
MSEPNEGNVSPPGAPEDGATVESPGGRAEPPREFVWLFAPAVVVLAAALVDVAVETALAGAPARWWVAGAVGVSLALVALLWRIVRWPTRAGLLFLALLCLAAGTAWVPGGLDQGIVFARQPTGAVLSGLSALALVLAGVAALRWRALHLALRVPLVLLAAYGLAGFVLGVLAETPFSALFNGRSFIERLPFQAQAAVVGALGVVPIVLLGELIRGVARVRGRALRPWAVQLLAFGAAIAIAVAGLFAHQLEAVLAAELDEAGVPLAPGRSFPENAERIHLAFASSLAGRAAIVTRWSAVEAEAVEPGASLGEPQLTLDPGERGSVAVTAPKGGFAPGTYQVAIEVDGEPHATLVFEVETLFPPAVAPEAAEVSRGFNVALAALGGRVERASSQYDESTWAAANLIDGAPLRLTGGRGGYSCSSCGWAPRDPLPQEIVFSFNGGREATLSAVIVDTRAEGTTRDPTYLPKHVEVLTSSSGPMDGFTQVGGGRLPRRPGEWLIALAPTRARYVKLRFLSSYGQSGVQVAEVKVVEDAQGGASVAADIPRNLALPTLGGAVVRFTSQYSEAYPAGKLIDGNVDAGYWSSKDAYLPQDLVFAARRDQEAFVESLVLMPARDAEMNTWARKFSVSVSRESPLDDFEEVGTFDLAPAPREQSFPIGRRARFVKLRILENGGGKTTSLGEVKLIEGAESGYESVLFVPLPAGEGAARVGAVSAAAGPANATPEAESNDSPAQANALAFGRFARGSIDPLGESDFYSLVIPAGPRTVLTLDLLGRPYIRTSLALLDATGGTRKRFDPGQRPGAERTFSWLVDSGPHHLHVTEPPVSMVVIWDTSGSMQGNTEDLRAAVEAYMDQVQPSERLNLIRFSKDVEVLLADFTNDRARLRAATKDKFFADGGTPLYDAIQRGIELLEPVSGNRAIVVMTDGLDTGSRLPYPDFWTLLDAKRIRLYTIGLGASLEAFEATLGNTPRRMLGHVALATNGRFFFARTSDELVTYYEEIAAELRTLSTYFLKPEIARAPGTLEVVETGEHVQKIAAPRFSLILDASGSMRERKRRIDGRLKIEVARDVMVRIIDDLPDGAEVSLRVYGRRIREGRPGDCEDSEMLVPLDVVDKPSLIQTVRGIQALGTTPLAYTLEQVVNDFGGVTGEKFAILVTDGKEECDGDPIAVAQTLVDQGLNVRFDVVGFDLAEEAVKRDMTEVARITGGNFYDASDAAALQAAIEQALAVPFEVFDAAGERVAGGKTAVGAVQVPEGVYTVVIHSAGEPIEVPDVRVSANDETRIELKKEGQEVGIKVVMASAQAPPPPATPAPTVPPPPSQPTAPSAPAAPPAQGTSP